MHCAVRVFRCWQWPQSQFLLQRCFLPVLQVTGTSMEPTLYDGDIIVLTKKININRGDLCGFYYQNKLLLKRVIGLPGDWIDIKRGRHGFGE